MSKNTGKKWANSPFEFKLKINGNIICQRGFNVNGYNKKVAQSYEIKELMDRLTNMGNSEVLPMGIIPKHLKKQSENYLYERYAPYLYHSTDEDKKIHRKDIRKDYFSFEIWKGNILLCKSVFENRFMLYNPKNQVDITDIVEDIVDEIVDTFTLEEYRTTYLDKDLTYMSPIWKHGIKLSRTR